MRIKYLAPTVALLLCLGCGGSGGPDARSASGGSPDGSTAGETFNGLRRAEIDAPGVLFIRDDHAIGSYDAFLIPESSIAYQRRSKKLPADLELEFLATLEQTLVDAAEDAEIPVVRAGGQCVMQVGMGLTNVAISRKSKDTIGRMTLVMEFRDTETGEILLHYATQNEITSTEGDSRAEQVRASFEEMVAAMEISGALQAAGLTEEISRPPCQGTLAKRGRRAAAGNLTAR